MQDNLNRTLVYGEAFSNVEMTIESIKAVGVDVTNYERRLKGIEKEVNDKLEIFKNSFDNDISSNKSKAYEYGTEKLNSFMEELVKYKVYYQTVNECMYLYDSQDLNLVNEVELADAVKSLIDCLEMIKTSNTLTEDINVIRSLYDIVYNIIKLEYKINGKSKLMEYCKEDKINSAYLSKSILNDLKELSDSRYDIKDIDGIVRRLKSKADFNTYLDDELLMALSIVREKEGYLKNLCSSIEDLKEKLAINNNNIEKLLEKKDSMISQKTSYRKDIRNIRGENLKSLSKGALMLFLSAGIILGVGSGLIRISKGNVYMTDTEIYSTDTGKSEKSEGYERKIISFTSGIIKNVEIKAYDPWVKDEVEGTYKRTVRRLYVSDIDLDNAKDYLDLNLEDLGYKYSTSTEEKSKLTLDDLYTESIYEVKKEVQNTDDMKVGEIEGERWLMIVFFGGILAAIYGGLCFEAWTRGEVFGIILSIREIIDNISYFDSTAPKREQIAKILANIEKAKQELEKLVNEKKSIDKNFNDVVSKPESKKLLEKYQRGLELLEEYYNEQKRSNELTLKMNRG